MTDVDVVVAGAGAAGLFAALAAADAGRSVIVLERDARWVLNANTARSTGLITAGGTRQQAAAGVVDTPELYARDLLRKNRSGSDPGVVVSVAQAAAGVVDVAQVGWHAPLEFIPDLAFPGHSVNRAHGPSARKGRILLKALIAAVGSRPSIQLIVGIAVRGLISERGNAVTGVLAAPDGQRPELLTAGRVILAVNGFGANTEWVQRYAPEISGATYFGGPWSDGSGIRWGAALGAEVATMDAYQGHSSISPDAGTLIPFAIIASGGVMLNGSGSRFGDEAVGYSEFALSVVRQTQNSCWTVFDSESYRAALPYEDFQDSVGAGVVLEASGLQELARLTRLPPNALELEFDALGDCVRTSAPDRFGRLHHRQLAPPLFAVRTAAALFHTQGGLRVDETARVLRPGGAAIHGLYAAGGTAAGISGHGAAGYMAGNGLTSAAVLGYLAGADDH